MQNELVSVIVPVFNTEKYLPACIESVLAQSYKNIELILVNDGSADSSGKICSDYAVKHDNIKILSGENNGAAASRNKGMQASNGKYILFLDSDDFYSSNKCIEELCAFAKKSGSDLVCFNYNRVNEKGEILQKDCISSSAVQILDEKNNALPKLIKENIFTSSSCLKLILRELLTNNEIEFRLGLRCEDIDFCMKLMQCSKAPSFINKSFYNYMVRSGSTTQTVNDKTVKSAINSIKYMLSLVSQSDALYGSYMSYIAFQYCTLLINMHLAKVPKKDKNMIYNMKYVLKYSENSIVKLVGTVSRIIGIKAAAYLLYIYFKIKN